jgi:hypothetical protein
MINALERRTAEREGYPGFGNGYVGERKVVV